MQILGAENAALNAKQSLSVSFNERVVEFERKCSDLKSKCDTKISELRDSKDRQLQDQRDVIMQLEKDNVRLQGEINTQKAQFNEQVCMLIVIEAGRENNC